MGIKEVYKEIKEEWQTISNQKAKLKKKSKGTMYDKFALIETMYMLCGIEMALLIIEEECPEVKEIEWK